MPAFDRRIEDVHRRLSAYRRECSAPIGHPRWHQLLRRRHAPATYRSFDCKSRFSADSAANPSSTFGAIGGVLAATAARWRWCERNRSEVGSTPPRDNRRRPSGAWAANKSPVRSIMERTEKKGRAVKPARSDQCCVGRWKEKGHDLAGNSSLGRRVSWCTEFLDCTDFNPPVFYL
jgi:hypothetical protein